MYKGFLSYDQLKSYLPILTDSGLLRYDEETVTFKITEKGLRFLQIYHKIHKITTEGKIHEADISSSKDDKSLHREKEGVADLSEIKAPKLEDNKDNDKPLARLLLVDDNSDITKVLKYGLEVNGFQVDAYTHSIEALDAFKPDVYDLVILDIRMPGLSGFELYREIKKRDSAITACFLSAFEIYPDEFEKVFPSLKEVKTIIKKPVSINNLLNEIAPLLRMSTLARAHRGEHLLIAFDTTQELIEQSLQFLKAGLLEKDEDILLVTDELPKDTIRERIAKEWNIAEDVKGLETNGRVTLMTSAESYLIDGNFDIERIKAMIATRVQRALDSGREGLRCAVDIKPFFDRNMIQELIAWESSVDKQFDLPLTALCAYTIEDIKKLDNSLRIIIREHHNRMLVMETVGVGD